MNTFLLRYRIKLKLDILKQDLFFCFVNGFFPKEECDYELIDASGNVIKEFTNNALDTKNSFESTAVINHAAPVDSANALTGNFVYYDDIYYRKYFIGSYVIYENADIDTLYITKADLTSVKLLESTISSLLDKFLLICQEAYDIDDLSYQIDSISISEDGLVAKVKMNNFYQLKEDKDQLGAKLNRIFPA